MTIYVLLDKFKFELHPFNMYKLLISIVHYNNLNNYSESNVGERR